jgi:hypothetical protein
MITITMITEGKKPPCKRRRFSSHLHPNRRVNVGGVKAEFFAFSEFDPGGGIFVSRKTRCMCVFLDWLRQ